MVFLTPIAGYGLKAGILGTFTNNMKFYAGGEHPVAGCVKSSSSKHSVYWSWLAGIGNERNQRSTEALVGVVGPRTLLGWSRLCTRDASGEIWIGFRIRTRHWLVEGSWQPAEGWQWGVPSSGLVWSTSYSGYIKYQVLNDFKKQMKSKSREIRFKRYAWKFCTRLKESKYWGYTD